MPDFVSASKQYSGKVQFIGIDAIGEDSMDGLKGFIKKYNIGFPVILDKGNTLASRYGLAGHPETVIISRSDAKVELSGESRDQTHIITRCTYTYKGH